MIPAFEQAVPVLKKIEDAGFEAYFVGGSVRDFLLKRKINDVDIATSATPTEIKAIFSKTIDVGIMHGTVAVLYGGQFYEITTFRTESEYADFRRPNEVAFIRSLNEDLKRRDFTMNAIALDKAGKLYDPYGGVTDLQQEVIRTVGEPAERFSEDALRMMRAVRFVSQLSFTIEPKTYEALKIYGQLLLHIAVERILIEFEKLLCGADYKKALTILLETGLFEYLPGFKGRKNELHAFRQCSLDANCSLEEYWTMLLFQLKIHPDEVGSFLKKWKQPTKTIKRIKNGLIWLNYRLQNEWTIIDLYRAQEELALSTERLVNGLHGVEQSQSLQRLANIFSTLPIKSRHELQVTGKDLMNWYDTQGGPWIEEKLLAAEQAVVSGQLDNEKEAIREWFKQCNQQ